MMNVSAGTVARTIWLVTALINQVISIAGKEALPFTEGDVYQIVSLIFTASAALTAWWKNNSFTKEAIEADVLMKEAKAQNKL